MTAPPGVGTDLMVRPIKVTVAATLAATVPDCSVMTSLESPAGPARASATPLNTTLGAVPPAAKNPEGYISVTVSDCKSAPPAVGVNVNVAGTPALCATRSATAMEKLAKTTAPPINPDGVLSDGSRSRDV